MRCANPAPNPDNSSVRRIKLEPINPSNYPAINHSNINFEQIANNFKTNLNQWLNEAGWLNEDGNKDTKIKKVLESYYPEKEEIQIFIQTENRELQGLPWQEWDVLQRFFINHPNTEVSISATNFKRPDQKQTLLLDARVRILAVFGDEKLGLDEEKIIITSLEKYGGLIKFLHQPDQETLKQALQEPKGWHIFFFAGHSGSDENGKIGWIEINSSERIPINNLTTQLEKLIRDKLQLAIFNSCDGLGLANQLTSLSLPYCIVMREPVESLFARRLLKHLLTAFVKGKSLFASMRTAPISVFKKHKYIIYLIVCDTGLLLWCPFYSYYTNRIKPLLFDTNRELNNLAGLVYLLIFSLLVMTLIVTMTQLKSPKYRYILSFVVIAVVVLTNLMRIWVGISLIDQMFGISCNSTFITWLGAITFFIFLSILIIYLIDNKVREI